MNALINFLQKLKATFSALPTPQKIFYLGSLLILVGSLSYLAYSINQPQYTTLYSGLSDTDLNSVLGTLSAQKVPYQLAANNSVEVPANELYRIRLDLAKQGIPKGPGVGFGIFDKQQLGTTEFVQKVDYQRALQGELARTIDCIDGVMASRVHLVLPKQSLFLDNKTQPSAAVMLKLRPGTHLGRQEIKGIQNLLAGAVQGMDAGKVTVMSTNGKVLSESQVTDSSLQMTDQQMQYQNNLEDRLRQKIQSMLEPIVGPGKVLAQVSVALNFDHAQSVADTYDPDSAVIRSQQRSIETVEGGNLNPKGNPDAPINVQSQLMQTQTKNQKKSQKVSKRQRETENYEINHVRRQTTYAPGSIKRLSVAVVIDGPYKMKPNGKGKMQPVFVGRSSKQLLSLENIVKNAVGYNDSRGDQITISNIPFAGDTAADQLVKPENRWLHMLKDNQRLLLNLLLIVLAFFFIVKPFMKKFQNMAETFKSLPQPASASLPQETGTEMTPVEEPATSPATWRRRSIALVQQDPERATEILRSMLREEK